MGGTGDVRDREPTTVEEALAQFDSEIRRTAPRRVTLDEIVEVIRADREAADR